LVSCGGFAGVEGGFGHKGSAGKFEQFAEISGGFFLYRVCATVAALISNARSVTGAVEANAEIGVAAMARFTSSGLAWQSPFPAATLAMSS